MRSLVALVTGDAERTATIFLLVLARTVPLAFLAPWLGTKGTLAAKRIAIATVLAVALLPLAAASAPTALPPTALTIGLAALREALIGAAFAVAISTPLYAMGWTGELVDRWRGSSSSSAGASLSSPLGTLYLMGAVVLFVLLGGHRLALATFAQGLVDVPAGTAFGSATLQMFVLGTARVVAHALVLCIAFVAPAALAFLILELTLGIFGRAAPTVRLWMEAMPLRAALGVAAALLSLSALLPRLAPVFRGSIDSAADLLRGLW